MAYQKFKDYISTFVQPTEDEWLDMAQYYRVKKLAKNDFLIKEGQICREMNFLNTGICRTFNLKNGKEITTNFFFDGSFITDYSSLITQKPTTEYIQVLEECEVIYLPYQKMQEFYQKYASMQLFGRLIAEKVFLNLYQRQQDFLLLNPKERYLALMERRPKVVLNLPQIYVASYLGITPEYLSRLRRELRV